MWAKQRGPLTRGRREASGGAGQWPCALWVLVVHWLDLRDPGERGVQDSTHTLLPDSLLGIGDSSQINFNMGPPLGKTLTPSKVRSCIPVTVTPDLLNSYCGRLGGAVIRS